MSGFLCSMVGATFTVTATVNVLRGANTITANGNAQVSTAQSKFGGASALFDGNGDYLNIPTNTTFNFGTGDFTLEAWIRRTSQSGDTFILSASGSGGLFWGFRNGTDMGWGQNAISWDYNVAAGLSINTWYHVALTRSGTSMRMFVNGTQIGTTQTNSISYNLSTTSFNIGSQGANYYYDGYIDEVRVSNTARYTANFTAPAVAFVNDANTVFLMHANGTNASTTFTDDNGARAQNGISAIGNAQVSTAQSKFGGSSALLDGTGDYLFSPSNDAFGFGTSDFTLEGWFRFTNFTNGPALFDLRASGGTEVKPVVYCGSDGVIYYYVNGATAITGNTLSANTWYHIALSRSAGVTKLFRDGTQIGSNYTDTNNYPATVVSIGIASWNTSFNALNGYVDEVRISNSARYTTTFTPSTTAFVNDANTLLLIHANGTNASTVFTDDNSILNVTSAATSVNEGSSLTFNVATQNLANQTLYYSLSNSGDFATSTGSFSLTNNSGSFSVTPTADTTTEGAETFTASVRIGSTSGTVISTSSAVTINDTSLTPALARPYASVATSGASVDTTNKQFGTGSLGYTGGHLVTSLNLPTGNFTIEYFVRVDNRSDRSGQWEITSGSHRMFVQSGEIAGQVRNIRFFITNSSGTTLLDYASAGSTLPDTTWRHLAFVRNSNDFYVYINGTRVTTSTQATFTMPNTTSMLIGRADAKFMRGQMDEFRISNTARYTGASLTVPTAAFTNDANTVLLLHMNGTSGSTSFPDDNA